MIENMSGFICPDCSKQYDIFGSGGAKTRADELKIPFLGDVPIVPSVREYGDAGTSQNNLEDQAVAEHLQTIICNLVTNMAGSAAAAPPQPQLPVLG